MKKTKENRRRRNVWEGKRKKKKKKSRLTERHWEGNSSMSGTSEWKGRDSVRASQ
jgi:hypothetical protein